MDFESDIACTRAKIAGSPIRTFAVPHLVVDDVLPPELAARINAEWPASGFAAEVPGNIILALRHRSFLSLSARERKFWLPFSERFWPSMVAACAEAMAPMAREVFGEIYANAFALQWPLTLMQAAPEYRGHGMHHHFYHCPHWAFTMLLYIDPQDRISQGTALHRLHPSNGAGSEPDEDDGSNYGTDNLDWRVKTAMSTMRWNEGNTDRSRVVDYRSNRLLVFLDGPMAFHSVPFDNPDHTPNPKRALDGGIHARRRILRTHTKVDERAFFNAHSRNLPEPLNLRRFARLMAPHAVWSEDDKRRVHHVVEPFFHERLDAYARAGARAGVHEEPSTLRGVGAHRARSTPWLLTRLGLSRPAERPDYEVFRKHARAKLFWN